MNKLYYTCPIKALYMMKEFGVGLEISGAIGQLTYQTFPDFIPFGLCNCPPTYRDLINHFAGKIYVAHHSEYIFKPKDTDLGIEENSVCHYDASSYDIDDWGWYYYGAMRCETKDKVKIILRNNKPFFMPEEEE